MPIDAPHILSVLLAILSALAEPHAPCFPDRPQLSARDVHRDLEPFEDGLNAPPRRRRGRYGRCTIADGVMRESDGRQVLFLGCGFTATAPGIVDDRGFGVGARGADILARVPRATERIACLNWLGDHDRTYCWFGADDEEGDSSEDEWQASYIVTGNIGGDTVRGEAAARYFSPRTVVALQVRAECH